MAVLEKNVVELQKLVDMKTQRLAELQQQASGKKEELKPATPAEPSKPVVPVEPPKAAEPAPVVEPPKPVEPPKAAEEPVKPVESPPAEGKRTFKPPEAPKQPAATQSLPESDFDPNAFDWRRVTGAAGRLFPAPSAPRRAGARAFHCGSRAFEPRAEFGFPDDRRSECGHRQRTAADG